MCVYHPLFKRVHVICFKTVLLIIAKNILEEHTCNNNTSFFNKEQDRVSIDISPPELETINCIVRS